MDSKLQKTVQAPGTATGEDEGAGVAPAVDPADIVLYLPGESVFVPREDGPAAAWLAYARRVRLV